MRLCANLGVAAVLILLPCISAYGASTRNKIDPDPLIPAEGPSCTVACGISCIRPWAPSGTAFPMLYDGGLFQCLRLGSVTPRPSGARSKPLLQTVQRRVKAVLRWDGSSLDTAVSRAVDASVPIILEKRVVASKFSRADFLRANNDSRNQFAAPR